MSQYSIKMKIIRAGIIRGFTYGTVIYLNPMYSLVIIDDRRKYGSPKQGPPHGASRAATLAIQSLRVNFIFDRIYPESLCCEYAPAQ